MLKKIASVVRQALLKVDWIKLEVEAYRMVQEERRRHEYWAKLMHSSQSARDNETNETDHRTLASVNDTGVMVDYMDMISQRHVEPVFLDSVNWGGMK